MKRAYKCPECGSVIYEDQNICSSCGFPVGHIELLDPVKICPHCGNAGSIKDRFCHECGRSFQEENISDEQTDSISEKTADDLPNDSPPEENEDNTFSSPEDTPVAEDENLKELDKQLEEKLARAEALEKQVAAETERLQEKKRLTEEKKKKALELQKKLEEAENRIKQAEAKAAELERDAQEESDLQDKIDASLTEEQIIETVPTRMHEDDDIPASDAQQDDDFSKETASSLIPASNDPDPFSTENKPSAIGRFKNKKSAAVIAVCAVAAIAGIVILALSHRQPIEKITLSKETATVAPGSTTTIYYETEPEEIEVEDKDISWSSSDESIATVENGEISGVSEGSCTITAKTRNGKTAECSVEVKKTEPLFKTIYDALGKPSYATLASDMQSLMLDSNPNDIKDHSDKTAVQAIAMTNELLGLPDSVLTKMGQTRALDGMQEYTSGVITVTWTYHPKSGLEVIYEIG